MVRKRQDGSWKDLSDQTSFPIDLRHGTFLPVDSDVVKNLMQASPEPANNN